MQYKIKRTKEVKNYVIKLHYKEEPLTKQQASLAIALLEEHCPYPSDFPTEYCIFDLRNGETFYKDKRNKNPMAVVRSEMEGFLSLWKELK